MTNLLELQSLTHDLLTDQLILTDTQTYHHYDVRVSAEITYKGESITLQWGGAEAYHHNDYSKPATNIDPDAVEVWGRNTATGKEMEELWQEWREEEDQLSEHDRQIFEKISGYISEQDAEWKVKEDMEFYIDEESILWSRGIALGKMIEKVDIKDIHYLNFREFIDSLDYEWSVDYI
tara:strand:- start:48 stop:581 length:534 start_codon:yes stop_codon:yes gene_type:complete